MQFGEDCTLGSIYHNFYQIRIFEKKILMNPNIKIKTAKLILYLSLELDPIVKFMNNHSFSKQIFY